jgi:hypothetical protein
MPSKHLASASTRASEDLPSEAEEYLMNKTQGNERPTKRAPKSSPPTPAKRETSTRRSVVEKILGLGTAVIGVVFALYGGLPPIVRMVLHHSFISLLLVSVLKLYGSASHLLDRLL